MQLTRNQQDALNIKKHVCVTAGAGSGKTTVLVQRYLKILREGNAKPSEIVAITFTDKAAAEMKDRVIKRLSEETDTETREKFREQMNSAHISTIHSFCSSILREFPFQADVPANFSIIRGIDQKLLLQKTIRETLKNIATNTEHPNRVELTRLLQRYGGQQKLVDFFSMLINQRDLVALLMQKIYDDRSAAEICDVLQQKALKQLMFSINIPEFIRCLNTVLDVAKGKKAEDVKHLIPQLEALHKQNSGSSEVPNLLKEIGDLITIKDGSIAKTGFLPTSIDRTSIADELNFLVSRAKKIKNIPTPKKEKNDDSKTHVETDDDFLISTTQDLLTLYKQILNNYQTAKLSQSTLDFSDLQLKTRDLLRSNEEIRKQLVERYQYYMIDEYQDTNELQSELVMLLTNELKSANLFIVGDPKQGIYGFRGADVRVFDKTQEKIIENGGFKVSLKENFRSLRDPLGFANYFFDRLMGDGSENEFEVPYGSLTKARPVNANGGVEIFLGKQGDEAVNEYEIMARHIKNMKATKETVWALDENGVETKRPIQYGDIAILIRSRRHLPDIEHALLEAGIPYLTTSGVGFYQRQEIYDIWNYLNFLNAPSENDASLAAILRSPAFGISDAELYEISLQEGTNFWEKAQNYQTHSEHLKRAIHTLKKHNPLAHRMPVNQLIATIVNETGLIGTLKTGIYGQQRSANYQKLLELARNFDGDENTQILPDFIEFLDILITEEPQEGQAPIEAGSGAVQIMTIHAAKGKEFPVVMLPRLDRGGQTDREPFIDENLGIGFSPLKPDEGYTKTEPEIIAHMKNRSSEKEIAEKKRLFYVGVTRAQDRLILSGTLPDKGNPQQILEWIYEHLGVDEEVNPLSLPAALEVSSDNGTSCQDFQLQIPIVRALTDLASVDGTSDETKPVKFPEEELQVLKSTETPAAFSIAELANYARCPLRYQLENVLRIPTNGQEDADADETETELHTSKNNFMNSELGEIARAASETRTNQQLHADIEGHIIDGRFDSLFKDEAGHWHGIKCETDSNPDSETNYPEMELYSLLLHRRYPEQPTVTMNLFFNEQDRYIQKRFNAAELQKAKEKWNKKISDLQQGHYNKNLDHCCSCPYADPDGQCIITEGEER